MYEQRDWAPQSQKQKVPSKYRSLYAEISGLPIWREPKRSMVCSWRGALVTGLRRLSLHREWLDWPERCSASKMRGQNGSVRSRRAYRLFEREFMWPCGNESLLRAGKSESLPRCGWGQQWPDWLRADRASEDRRRDSAAPASKGSRPAGLLIRSLSPDRQVHQHVRTRSAA